MCRVCARLATITIPLIQVAYFHLAPQLHVDVDVVVIIKMVVIDVVL